MVKAVPRVSFRISPVPRIDPAGPRRQRSGVPADLTATAHRPWPLPTRPWLWRQTWSDLAFLHYRIDAEQLRPLLPGPLRIQEFDGSAWLGVVPFRMRLVAPRGWPGAAVLPEFPELNLRTYVEVGGKPGVWFFSLDADSQTMVWGGRLLYGLPYRFAHIRFSATADGYALTSVRHDHRAAFGVCYNPTGPEFTAQPGTFEHWATERYCLYTTHPGGPLRRIDVHHAPWPLRRAEAVIAENTLTLAAGLALENHPPVCHFSPGVDVVSFPAMPAGLH